MGVLFLKLVNMSLTATWIILTVLILRRVFKKAPKWIFCVLWGFVAFRLTFVFESILSLIPNGAPLQRPNDHYSYRNQFLMSGNQAVDQTINSWLRESTLHMTYETQEAVLEILGYVWLIGMVTMLAYTITCYMRLRKQVETATLLCENVKQSEYVRSPFVLGFLKPIIYMPYKVDEADVKYIIIHEQAHIQRRDQWWQTIGFIYLSVYWFNPLIWVAYILFCKDMEHACDERAVSGLSEEERRAYSTALLNCSIQRWHFSACPIAFGEVNVKDRVTNVMSFCRPTTRIFVVSVVICILVFLCFGTNQSALVGNARWGIYVKVEETTPGSVRGILKYNATEKNDHAGGTFMNYLEKRTFWGWTDVEPKQDRYHDHAVNLMAKEGERYFHYNWERALGQLPNGIYRIRQPLYKYNIVSSDYTVIGEYYIPFIISNTRTK